ncbi:hypothetical protein [Urbifossiella limnaea]|uniref:Carboxypeptidase regulatory-like domain-containing protein n=1 Tax=Urbifossiella limnaea TaxID=2528023 RepID=A0A517XL96_9BACT|nr:hypothetical protein [Urbifossiella limnaea]QDU18236.1 hypothetical protein ETAA1_01190 [Urbifossiella limnaea]
MRRFDAGRWPVLLVVALVGCGGGKPTGTVAGTVSYNGGPVHSGSLNLISTSGAAALAKIGDGGAFKVDGELPAGDYTAYVTPPVPEPLPPGTKAAAPKKFEVPAKYQAPTTSGTTVTVQSGSNDLKVDFR